MCSRYKIVHKRNLRIVQKFLQAPSLQIQELHYTLHSCIFISIYHWACRDLIQRAYGINYFSCRSHNIFMHKSIKNVVAQHVIIQDDRVIISYCTTSFMPIKQMRKINQTMTTYNSQKQVQRNVLLVCFGICIFCIFSQLQTTTFLLK